jgi:NADP-dependent 3-hydroxy acid dehydrogenase YdfG
MSTGIGQAIAHYLLSQSHKLLVVSRTHEALDQLHFQYPDRVEVLAGDLSDLSVGAKAVELAISRWERLDAVIVNHGTLDPVKKVADTDAEEWRKSFDINVFSAISIVSSFCSTRHPFKLKSLLSIISHLPV